eukprot:CAMPEP_0185027626 /NCGR_PEP_ID=MMETSP1103-20130426/12885_1 /TAXON_ID=36769 /ORGANISM="Paraphysomonas bandaiensis, Strain Caron Lab Isolate" /LENGTH=189 /DNA_ID=CAMNT_0027561719 /DNA_START=295 /DNA_END=864 /DNA_ORIENTATION=+
MANSKGNWKLRCRIPSDLASLETLHCSYPWIPGPDQVRPSEKCKEHKAIRMQALDANWEGREDYILSSVFYKPVEVAPSGRFQVLDRNISGKLRFVPNEFPYQIDVGHHYILWFGATLDESTLDTPAGSCRRWEGVCPLSDEEINCHITEALKEIAADENSFDFAWYENPKMTVPEIYHVQVFWNDIHE